MGDIRKKTQTSIIYIIITLLLAALVSMAAGLYNEIHEAQNDRLDYLENFVETYDTLLAREHDEENRVRSDLKDIARLTVAAIKRTKTEILPSQYADGAIVRVTKKGIESPIEVPNDITPDVFLHEDAGSYDTSDRTMIYCHIKDDFYYMEMVDQVEKAKTFETAFAEEKSNIADALEDLATAHKCEYLYMKATDDNSGDYEIYCATGPFRKCSRLSQLDISEKDMQLVNNSQKKGTQHLIKVDGHRYYAWFMDVGDSKAAVMLMPVRAALMRTVAQTFILIVGLLAICILITAWILFIYYAVDNRTLSLKDRDKYRPRLVRVKVKAAVIIGTVLILVACLFTQSLESVFAETRNGSATLEALFHRIEDDRQRSEKSWQDSQNRYTAMADRVALLIDRNRDLQNRDWLKEASKIIGAEFLMVFDTEGKELVSDSPYKGLILGKTEDSATYDFRRLLRGVKSISHAGVKEELIGQKLDMYGIALRFLAENDAYGALILATDPAASGKKDFVDVDKIAGSMTAEKDVCFAVEPEKGLIKYSSDSSLSGRNVDIFKLDKNELHEDYMGSIKIKGQQFYATSARHEDLIYYYAVRSSGMLHYDMRYALIVSLLSLIMLAGLYRILLKDYREEEYMASFEEDISSEAETAVYHPEARDFMTSNIYSLGFLNKGASPNERLGSLILLCIAAILMPLLIKYYSGINSMGGQGSVMTYIGQGEWERGVNIFALTSSLLVFFHMTIVLITLKFCINLAGRFLGAKGHTVCTLLYNILLCFMAIIFVFVSLGYFGFDTRALLASFGLAGLAASLGAKDLVSDIIAGFTLMTDGSYKVGDTIEIDGFDGAVLKINMRKTTVMDKKGTVKTFSNSTITSVINHSLYPYIYWLEFLLPQECTVKMADEIINRELPKLIGKCPLIIDGPRYSGVSEVIISTGVLFTKIFVDAVCHYPDRYDVQYFLNTELKRIFENELIKDNTME